MTQSSQLPFSLPYSVFSFIFFSISLSRHAVITQAIQQFPLIALNQLPTIFQFYFIIAHTQREREREMYLKDIDTRPRTHPLTRHNLGKSPARPAIVAAVGFLDEKKLLIVMAHPHTVPLPLGKHFDLTPSAPPFSLSCFLSFHLCLLFVVSACNTRILHNLLGIFNKKYHKANTERLKRELWSNGCQHVQGERERERVRVETLLAIPNGGRLANFTLR